MSRSLQTLVLTATIVGSGWLVGTTAASADEGQHSPDDASGNCTVVIGTPASDHLPGGQMATAIKTHCGG